MQNHHVNRGYSSQMTFKEACKCPIFQGMLEYYLGLIIQRSHNLFTVSFEHTEDHKIGGTCQISKEFRESLDLDAIGPLFLHNNIPAIPPWSQRTRIAALHCSEKIFQARNA